MQSTVVAGAVSFPTLARGGNSTVDSEVLHPHRAGVGRGCLPLPAPAGILPGAGGAAGREVFESAVAPDRNAFIYVYDGQVRSGKPGQATCVDRWHAALLGAGDHWRVAAGDQGAGILFLSAMPTGEPVIQQGPFVMNTREEVEQAMRDYRDGNLTAQED